jgi:uncharacterized Zn finger protein (UPF0148 family)
MTDCQSCKRPTRALPLHRLHPPTHQHARPNALATRRTRRPHPTPRPHQHRHHRPQPPPRRTQRHRLRRRRNRPHTPNKPSAPGSPPSTDPATITPARTNPPGLAPSPTAKTSLIDWLTQHRRRHRPPTHRRPHLPRTSTNSSAATNKAANSSPQSTPPNTTSSAPAPPSPAATTTAHPRQCGHTLFADTYDRTVTCPTCHQTIDVETTAAAAAETRDLHTKTEHHRNPHQHRRTRRRNTHRQWIKAHRLRSHGWSYTTARSSQFEINPDNDQPVYSVERARKLRRRDQQLTKIRAKVRAT